MASVMTGATNLRKGQLVSRTYGDKYLRAEKGRVIWIRGDYAFVEWYCAGGASTKSRVKVGRLMVQEA